MDEHYNKNEGTSIENVDNSSLLIEESQNNNKKDDEEKKAARIGCLPFIIGGMSFIPLIGIIFGIITIILGFIFLKKRGWRLIVLGLSGILFTIILYTSLFYFGFVQRGGVYDKLRNDLAETQLTQIVTSVEYFKIQNGRYPDSLSELAEKSSDKMLFIIDVANIKPSSNASIEYYYELINNANGYYLFSSGIDGVPFSKDDILPDLSEDELKNIGYKIRPVK
jgi:hypothetical protein